MRLFFVTLNKKMTTYDIHKIATLLIPTVGFRQTVAKKEYLDLDVSLLPDLTEASIYVNSLTELFLSVEAMSNALVFDEGYDVDTWLAGSNYVIGNRVKKVVNDRTYVWVSKTSNIGQDPESNPDDWKTALSDRLDKYRESAALETISGMVSSQINNGFSSELNASDTTYRETSTILPVQLKGRFVGICIKPMDYRLNRILTIDKLGMHITGAQSDLTLYLFHSSKKDAIQTFTIASANQSLDTHKWYDLIDGAGNPIIIDLFNPDFNQGGVFYLGFFESDFTTNGQGYGFNESSWAYGSIGRLHMDDHFSFDSIEIPSSKLNGIELPDIGQYYDGVNYNSEIAFNNMFVISQSFYPQLSRNIMILQKSYQYVLAFMILKDMLHNDRISHISDNAQNKIHELLYGAPDNEQDRGIQHIKMVHMEKLNLDMDQIFDNFKGMHQGAI